MRKVVAVLILAFGITHVLGQGCSDPGLCTIGSLNTEISKDSVSPVDFTNAEIGTLMSTVYAAEKYRFMFNEVYGSGDEDVQIFSSVIQLVARVKEKMVVGIKVPYTLTTGTLGSANGLGDITLNMENTFVSGKNRRFSYTLGVVLPSGDANTFYHGNALPMAYQTTLGSINLLGGLSFAYKKWSGSVGYQHSFGSNENQFISDGLELTPGRPGYDPLNAERIKFPTSSNLNRGSDLMLRLERKFAFSDKWNLALGVLPIYRLTESKVTVDSMSTFVTGTSGLTFNTTAGVSFFPSKNWMFRINGGKPLKIRDESADGLYRDFVLIASVAYRLW